MESFKPFVFLYRTKFNHTCEMLAMRFILLLVMLNCHLAYAGERLAPALDALEARDFDIAIARLQQLEVDRDVLFHLARAQLRAGAFGDADETIEQLHKAYPEDAEAWYLTGLVKLSLVGEVSIFRKVGMAKQTLAAFENSVRIDPNHLNSRYAILAFYANAPGIAGGDLEKAQSLQPVLDARDPGFGAMAKALLLSKENDNAATEAAYRDAIRLLDRAGPHFALAQFYMRTEQWQKALVEIEQYHAKEKRWWDPDITLAHLIAARANAELGKQAQAKELANMALAMNPNKQVKGMLEDTLESL